jgi:hypothetical protein
MHQIKISLTAQWYRLPVVGITPHLNQHKPLLIVRWIRDAMGTVIVPHLEGRDNIQPSPTFLVGTLFPSYMYNRVLLGTSNL